MGSTDDRGAPGNCRSTASHLSGRTPAIPPRRNPTCAGPSKRCWIWDGTCSPRVSGVAAAEYKDIADGLVKVGVLSEADGIALRKMAGYRNRMVHFYHEVSIVELYRLCSERSADIDRLCNALTAWLKRHPRADGPGYLVSVHKW